MGTGLWTGGRPQRAIGFWSDKPTKSSPFCCAHCKSSALDELLATLWTGRRWRWKPWAGADGPDQLLNNCSLHSVLQRGLPGPSQKHLAALLRPCLLRTSGPALFTTVAGCTRAARGRTSGGVKMERRFPRHPTGPSCKSNPAHSRGCSCMEVWVFKLNSKKTAGTEKRKPSPSKGEALLLPPDSFPWAQQLGVVQQVTYPPSLSRRLRWRSTTGSKNCQANLTWSTVAQGRSQEHGISEARVWKFPLQRLLFLPPLSLGAIRHPQPGKAP